jgi:acyl-coenzyme A thioesterase PaaI-like protein
MLNTLRKSPFFLKMLLNTYAPYVGAGVRIQHLDLDEGIIDVEMPLTRFNKNYVGTHFGGSLYSMVDPFYMLILINRLGPDYVVWDKAANIDFKSPGRGRVRARIHITIEDIDQIRELAAAGGAVLQSYTVRILADDDHVVAEVQKTLYIRKKQQH